MRKRHRTILDVTVRDTKKRMITEKLRIVRQFHWIIIMSLLFIWQTGVSATTSSVLVQEMGKIKAELDRDPHIPLTPLMRQLLTEKQYRVEAYRHQQSHPQVGSISPASAAYQCNVLPRYQQQGQRTFYYCGPAAVSEALFSRGIVLDQDAAAALLRTSVDGTAWSGVYANVPNPTGYPVPDVLNYELGTTWYLPQAVAYSPTSSERDLFINRLTFDIDAGWPVIGDAWELAGCQYPHLNGHPCSQQIFHWFTIYGYCDWGNTTFYMDSATTVWPSVQPYNSIDTATLVVILGGRGYVW